MLDSTHKVIINRLQTEISELTDTHGNLLFKVVNKGVEPTRQQMIDSPACVLYASDFNFDVDGTGLGTLQTTVSSSYSVILEIGFLALEKYKAQEDMLDMVEVLLNKFQGFTYFYTKSGTNKSFQSFITDGSFDDVQTDKETFFIIQLNIFCTNIRELFG